MKAPPERLGSFYLGAEYDLKKRRISKNLINYDARDLTTHAVCFGMTGSGKTGLCIGLLEEAALDKVPAILVDPKGDITNMLLQFPELLPEDFLPWINPDDARRKGKSLEEYAEYVADLWRKGLSEWGVDAERIRSLNKSADFAIFTPGSDAGLPISIINSLAAPGIDFDENAELIRERINGTVAALMELVGIDADPVRSREAILLSTIFEHFWRRNENLDLTKLITSIQSPPVDKLGVFDVDTFYPENDRFKLAMAFNSLVASPSFQSWLKGEPLDIDRLLYTEEGKPRHSIFYIAHLSDRERMFFVTLLLENVLMWVRRQTGTTSLRALLYFDEVFGFMPPVAEPPTKRPLMTLLKTARAFGLGVVLVTQNPVDIDYKGLTNTGTWFIGKLQTERDKDRVLHGLKGAITQAGGSSEKANYDAIISKLSSRVFLMHNVHQDEPVVFYTRWVMSYLRGPLTRPQVRQLMEERKKAIQTITPEPTAARARAAPHVPRRGPLAAPPPQLTGVSTTKPALDPKVPQVFLPIELERRKALRNLSREVGRAVEVESTQLVYEPGILGHSTVRFVDRKRKIDERVERILLASIPGDVGGIDWDKGEAPPIGLSDLLKDPEQVGPGERPYFAPAPKRANTASEIKSIGKDLSTWLYDNSALTLKVHPDLGIIQHPGESEREFTARLTQAARERRDEEVDKLEKKYAKRLDKLESKVRRLELELADDKAEYDARKREEMVGAGESVLSFFMGRRRTTAATAIARRRRMTAKAKREIKETEEEITEVKEDTGKLEDELKEAVAEIAEKWENAPDDVVEEELKPRRTDVNVKLVALAWLPFWLVTYKDGGVSQTTNIPAYPHTEGS